MIATQCTPSVAETVVRAQPCDLCAGGQFRLISRLDRKGRPLLTDVCESCGLVAHHDLPSEEEIGAFYATEYRRAYHGEVTPGARRIMRAWKNAERIHRELSPFLGSAAHDVFEVGAGIGCNVKVFEQQGHAASGIEPNRGFQRYAEQRLKARVTNESLEDLAAQPRYDLILLVHVIEHLRSPRKSLVHLHRLLRPEGLLYVECPNLGAPFTTRGKLFHFAHIYNFTRQTLGQLAEHCGFRVERWFGEDRDPNLAALLRRHDAVPLQMAGQGCQGTLDALTRYNSLTFHLRWSYLRPRVTKLLSYLWEHAWAERYVARLLRAIDPNAPRRVAAQPLVLSLPRRRQRRWSW